MGDGRRHRTGAEEHQRKRRERAAKARASEDRTSHQGLNQEGRDADHRVVAREEGGQPRRVQVHVRLGFERVVEEGAHQRQEDHHHADAPQER